MNTFLVIEEISQDDFKNRLGIKADPLINVVGVYSDKDKAEREKENLAAVSQKLSKETGADLTFYYVEERPLL